MPELLRLEAPELRAEVVADLLVPLDLRALVPLDLRVLVPLDLRVPVPLDLRVPVPLDLRVLARLDERLEPVPEDFARLVLLFFVPLDEPLERELLLLLRPPADELVEREADAPELRAPRDELDAREPPLDDRPPSPPHSPDITRCAASATASAISDPSRVALETTVLAAVCAVSAASIPASRILRRAAGLALIAAAAAASPAASISRLIAAFASLSTVDSFDVLADFLFDLVLADFVEDVFRLLDFAIANLPWGPRKRHSRGVTVPAHAALCCSRTC